MGRFQVMAQSLAVAGDRLVVIVSVEPDGLVMVRDLANGRVHAVNPSDLSAPPPKKVFIGTLRTVWVLVQPLAPNVCKLSVARK